MKSSDKLLNYLMLGQTLIEVKLEMLKTHEFHPWSNFRTLSCGWKSITPMIGIDPQSVYQLILPMILAKLGIFLKSTVDAT